MVESNAEISNAIFNLMRRLPPTQIPKTLAGVGEFIESDELREEIFD